MLKSKKFKVLSLLALSFITLTSCDTEYNRYPVNYDDPLFSEIANNQTINPGDEIFGNKWQDYYDTVMTTDTVYSNTVKQILMDISKVAHDWNGTNGSSVTDVTIDSTKAVRNRSVMNSTVEEINQSNADITADTNLLNRAEESMMSNATSDSYTIDNEFYETKFVNYLKQQFELPTDFDESLVRQGGKFVTSLDTFDDVFSKNADGQSLYLSYMQDNLYDDNRINYLTSEFIYNKSFSSIGNTNARKVQIAAITDRSDIPGAAKRLLDAYINTYVRGTDPKYRDDDFTVLTRLWKGITKIDLWRLAGVDVDYEANFANYDEVPEGATETQKALFESYLNRYGNLVLTKDEVIWLNANNIISNDGTVQNTLAGKVYDDQVKMEESDDNYYTINTTLENQYTGSYTYDYKTGLRMAYDDIAQANYLTDGVQLSSDGLSALPDTLKSRIFSTKYAYTQDQISEMAAAGKGEQYEGTSFEPNTNLRYDITTYCADGNRYLTFQGTTDDSTSLLYYDTSSKTYYIVRILDVVTNTTMSSSSSVYNDSVKKEQIAREVAYAMSTTGTYKSDATIYWLRRTKIDYSDEDFLEYMKSNYQDLFRTESSNDSEDEPLITLDNGNN